MLDKIKKLREITGAGMVDVKKALDEAQGDEERATEILKKKCKEKAFKKSERIAQEGVIVSYVHSNNKVGAIVKLFCETDFVARNEEFKTLAQDIAMHITAMNPKYIKPEEVDENVLEKERKIWQEQLENENKPKEIISKIISGKEKKFREEISLLSQPFVKNQEQTIQDLIIEKIAKIGENIQVGEFYRIEL